MPIKDHTSGPQVNNIETVFARIKVEIGPKALGRGEIVSVIVQNPLVNADGTGNTSELFFGDATNQIYHMLPGMESPITYAEDLKDLYIKLNPLLAGQVISATIENAGADYLEGDVLTLVQSGSGGVATVTVTEIDGDGGIVSVDITTPGTNYTEGIVTTTGGEGEGATFTITTSPILCDACLFIVRERKGGLQ